MLYGIISHYVGVKALGYLAFDTVERATADEEDVACIDLKVLLIGMLAPALGRNIHGSAFEQFQQTLLHTLTTHVARDAGVVGLTCHLVYLIDEHYAPFGLFHIAIGHLEQTTQYALHVLAHITGFGEHRSVHYSKRHIKQAGYGASQQCLACSCRADHDDVTLLYLNSVICHLTL